MTPSFGYLQGSREPSKAMGAVTGSVVCGVQGRLPKKEAQVTRREGQGREWGAEFQAEKVAGTEQTGSGVV